MDSNLESDDIWLITPRGVPLPEWWERQCVGCGNKERADRARSIATRLLAGLVVAHQQRVIHRDIKPENVILLDDQDPVLIDFGIAFIRDGARLTEVDGRSVANNFAAPPAAYYGKVDDPKPWWDCLGLAWLWGWMLSSGRSPKYSRFHWKYHDMIESDDSDKVRALVAVCSDESTAPTDATALSQLIARLGLGNEKPATTAMPSSTTGIEKVLEMQAQQLQEALIEQTERRERTESAALVLAPMYEHVRSRLKEIAARGRSLGLPIDNSALVNDHPIAICLSALNEKQMIVDLFECRGNPHLGLPFRIVLTCEYRQPLPGTWPFVFALEISPGPSYADNHIIHMTDGAAFVERTREPAADDHFSQIFERWLLHEPAHWEKFRI